ncbi:MAG: hypothetical protein U0Z53_23735 [Blastocatellia bacterium]
METNPLAETPEEQFQLLWRVVNDLRYALEDLTERIRRLELENDKRLPPTQPLDE